MFKSIAVAFDGSEGSKIAFAKAMELKQDFPALKLSIIFVNEETPDSFGIINPAELSATGTTANIAQPSPGLLSSDNASVDGSPAPDEALERQPEFSKHLHNSIQQQLDEKNIKATVLALEGNAAKTIPAYIEEQKIELLVIGNSGKSGLQKFFIGSVSKNLLKDSPCSVLVVK